ncbi:MAG TPA: HAMP domain-containing sensor histidine kinase [Cyclobacteriaceae bacterium]|nr:HAMP domain-containing sensor histidine kinase [Cyclobacteriaceae bacterium]
MERERALSELKSRFVSMASHEFRTPLSALLSSAALAQQYLERGEASKTIKHIEKIKASVKNLNDILNDFLSLDKLEQGGVQMSITRFDLREFAEGICEEMENFIKPGQDISMSFDGPVDIDQDQHILRNVLINLLSNASKYSGEEKIQLVVAATPDSVSIRVIDKGIGIPEHQQQHIFGRFFRADNTSNIQGTGLGLNIVKRYVELMKGSIAFKSELGVGTTFHIELPRA